MKVLGSKKHLYIVLFRLAAELSIENFCLIAAPPLRESQRPASPRQVSRSSAPQPPWPRDRPTRPTRSRSKTIVLHSFPHPAPSGRHCRAASLPHCVFDGRPPRREKEPGSKRAPPPRARRPFPRPSGTRRDQPPRKPQACP